MKRRDFLKQTGLILTALGISETGLLDWVSRSQQALAQSSRRQLALLIGINQYPGEALADSQTALHGCLNDIDLQRELLIHRFGVQPVDILTLTNEQATGQAIVDAIIHHLYEQAQPGDSVFLHFSGYGSRLNLAPADTFLNSWVPYDARLPTEDTPVFNDLSEPTLATLLKLIKTKQITTVLDAGLGEVEVPLAASLRSRARAVTPTAEALAELPNLATFFEQVGQSPEPPAHFPGLLLRAAPPDSPVVERTWDGFSAGLFTYALTQYLWTVMPATTIQAVMGHTRQAMSQWIQTESPQVSGKREPETEFPYDSFTLLPDTNADGVVVGVSADGNTADLWLGGFPPEVVQYGGDQSWVQITHANGETVTVQLRSQSGLHAKAKRPDNAKFTWQVGQRVQEAIRILPRTIPLVVALDNRLERIERVDATSALATLPYINAIATEEQPADYLFGKPLQTPVATLTASLDPATTTESIPVDPVKQGYGLFSPARTPIPGTLAKQDEAIKAAVSRLTPKLQSLLAIKLLRLTCNQASSQLPARLNLEMLAPQEKLLLQQETLRSQVSLPKSRLAVSLSKQPLPLQLAQGSRIRYRLFNFSPDPLYFLLISLDTRDRVSVFFPPITGSDPRDANTSVLQDQLTVLPGTSVTVPQTTLFWNIEAPLGEVETFVVCSKFPFTETLALLSPLASTSTSQRINLGENVLTIVQTLIADMHNGNRRTLSSSPDTYTLETTSWATFTLQYQTV